ncbi:hypothetical protein GMORB2_0382 [Geosmithia morbida]|uniref:Uncharacterized protein n=1 Tax=Geosmithia morbida TaxID=1094350 RepID=A0A9P5D7H6_9HYPO|nr:uncharacterized protein GMORB2_0382 [Geosmithia morbida]KAF4126646.1 hypothetical protein GMORB2_0382 [Geosmithia morbida]
MTTPQARSGASAVSLANDDDIVQSHFPSTTTVE